MLSLSLSLSVRRSLFHGKLVVHSGGGASGFKNVTDGDSYDTDGVCLFHVKGTRADNTYGVQVCLVLCYVCGVLCGVLCKLIGFVRQFYLSLFLFFIFVC